VCLAQLDLGYGETKVVLATPQARVAAHHSGEVLFVGVIHGLYRAVWDTI
jgi:hypothetical protein